jgi:putative ABC transport system permease protein
MLTEDNVRRGMTPEEARRAALIRVGGSTSLRERHREARGLPAFDSLLQDLRFALRLLVKDRWFTTAVVVALALGVGVNTTVFTVINGWNLRDLPVDEPGRLMPQVIDVSNLVTARLSLPPGKYGTAQERIAFYEQLELRIASIPSIASAAIGTALPFIGATRRDVALDSDLEAAAAGTRSAQTLAIGSRYFETLGLSMQRGRSFDARDGLPGQETAIVNERFVTMYLPGPDAIGRRIRLIDSGSTRASSAPLTIVGIAPTIRHTPARDASPVVYLPSRAQPAATMEMMMRSRANSTASVSLLREEVRTLDADVPLYNISTLERLSQQSRWTQRALSSMLGLFAAIATLLSAMGLYAITTYSISRRTSEIGIRMALGAQRLQVSWLFLRGTLVHVGLGLTIGLAGAVAMGQVLRGVLVQTNALDPFTFASVVVLLAVVAVVACLAPTWRASALDPAVALRRD